MPINIEKPKLVGLAARKAAAEAELALTTGREPVKLIPPAEAPERIGIVFDDSSSMGPTANENARKGVEEFLRSCKPNQTAVSVFAMNGNRYQLTTDLPALAQLVDSIRSSGSTPLLETLTAISNTNITRAIVFSDGEPNHFYADDYLRMINPIKEKRLPVDTVYIGPIGNEKAVTFMKKLAENTGGIFLHFDPAKSNFRTAFKYLAPVNRHMLADKSFVAKLEGR